MMLKHFVSLLILVFASIANAEDWSKHPVNEWVKQSPRPGAIAAPLKYEGSGAMNPASGNWIHFGGHDGIPQGFYLFTCDLASGSWRQWFPNTSPPGVCCVDGSNTFDAAQNRFVAFPGGSLGHGYQWSRGVKLKQSNAWLLNPKTKEWTNMRPPPYKRPEKYSKNVIGGLNSAATYDPNHQVTISFGGQGAGGPTNAIFLYDAYANRLVQRLPPAPPSPRDGMGLCYDSKNDCLVMFGSQYSNDEKTWLYFVESNRWRGITTKTHPPAKKEGTYSTNPKLVFDSVNGICMCVVRRGEKSGRPSGSLESWALDVSKMQWTKLNPKREPDPSASRARNLSYWPEQNLFVLETVALDKSGPQIWTFRYAKSTDKTSLGQPNNAPVILDFKTHATSVSRRTRIDLSWSAPKGNVAAYHILRAKSDTSWTAKYERIASTRKTSYLDYTAKRGEPYLYRIVALNKDGKSRQASRIVRTQPRAPHPPIVSVLATDRIHVRWPKHLASNIVGYNLYRGIAHVDTVKRGEPKPWRDNDPEYDEPVVVGVSDIKNLTRLNNELLTSTQYTDKAIDLTQAQPSSDDYKYAVYAYIVKAVNHLDLESGPSPYALTIPSAPQHVLLREKEGTAELKWRKSPESSVVGYHIYKLGKSHWTIERASDSVLEKANFKHQAGRGKTRYWIVPIDRLGQQGEPSSPVWFNQTYRDFFDGEWHQ